MLHNIERIGEQAIRKGVIYEEVRDREEMRIVLILDPIALQDAQIIDVAELRPQLLPDCPVALLPLHFDLAIYMTLQVSTDSIAIEQLTVYIEVQAEVLARKDTTLIDY